MKRKRKVSSISKSKRKIRSIDKGGIRFCKKCSAIMVPEKTARGIFYKCRRCGYKEKFGDPRKGLKIKETKHERKTLTVLEKDNTPLPITDRECPKCGNMKAYWWLQQTRASDEPPTQFFRCTKCRHVWREYK